MCLPHESPRGRNVSNAYEGRPPARSGIAAASSARQKQSTTPTAVRIANSGIDAPPSATSAKPTSPMMRIVPARPITNAPHQFVSLESVPVSGAEADIRETPPAVDAISGRRRVSHVAIATSTDRYARQRELAPIGGQAMTHDEVRKRATDDGIQFFLAQFVEMHGKPNAKLMPVQAIDDLPEEGAGFAGFAAGPMGQSPASPDMLAVPDTSSYTRVPWQPELVRFACDVTVEGEPWLYCPRTILRNAVARAADLGFSLKMGLEAEFFLVRKDQNGRVVVGHPLDTSEQPCYDAKPLYRNYEFLTTLSRYANELGYGNYANDHEDANGQFESNFAYDDALVTCDRAIFFRYMVHVMAQQRGKLATFMPKPFGHLTGNGCHFHLSLWDKAGRKNLFEGASDAHGYGLSDNAYHFIAGLIQHADAVSAIVAPTVNSYKRIGVGAPDSGATWSPAYAAWGGNNRTQMIRVPGAPRIEHRGIDGSANPYLAAAAVLAAGLDGVERKLDPGPQNTANLYTATPQEVRRKRIKSLPTTLADATVALRKDAVLRDWLGHTGTEYYSDYFADTKLGEFHAWHSQVSEWEVDRYLTLF